MIKKKREIYSLDLIPAWYIFCFNTGKFHNERNPANVKEREHPSLLPKADVK